MKANFLVLAAIYALISEIKTDDDIESFSSTCGSGTQGYCENCITANLCPASENPFIAFLIKTYEERAGSSYVPCPSDQVCIESGVFAYCDAPSSPCTCIDEPGVTTFCDPYNDIYVLTCYNGVIQRPTTICLEPNTKCVAGSCVHVTTLAPGSMTDSPEPTCSSDFEVYPKNCTSYYVCINGNLETQICKENQITSYDGSIVTCVEYEAFKCPTSGIGKYPDPIKCNVYYNCQNGNQIGPAQSCGTGQNFEPTSQTCSKDFECEDVQCTPCTDSNLRFAINCTSFYECSKDSEDNFVAEMRTCPPSLVFDPVNKFCTNKPVSGC